MEFMKSYFTEIILLILLVAFTVGGFKVLKETGSVQTTVHAILTR